MRVSMGRIGGKKERRRKRGITPNMRTQEEWLSVLGKDATRFLSRGREFKRGPTVADGKRKEETMGLSREGHEPVLYPDGEIGQMDEETIRRDLEELFPHIRREMIMT